MTLAKFEDLRGSQKEKTLAASNGETLKSSKFNQASFTEVAKACGVSSMQISYVMRGIKNPSLRVFKEMARFFGMTLDELDDRLEKVRKLRESGSFWPE